MCAHSKALYQANTTHFSKGNRSLLTASTRFTTDLAKFLVCCFVLCRLACVQTRKQRLRVKAAEIWNDVKADICCCCSQWTTYHTVVADNHDFQILHFLKYTSRHLQNKKKTKNISYYRQVVECFLSLWPPVRLHTHLNSHNSSVGEAKACCITLLSEIRDLLLAFSFASAKKSPPAPRRAAPPRLGTQTRNHGSSKTHIYNWVWPFFDCTPLWGSNFGISQTLSINPPWKHHVYLNIQG